VQPVGQLDHEDPYVAGHRDHHLADGLRLGGVAVVDLVELGDPVHEARDLVAELAAQLVEGVVGVLDGVVQQRGRDGRGRHAEVREDRGDGEGVGDVGVAALAELSPVAALGHDVGALDDAGVGLGVGQLERAQDRLEDRVGGRPPAEAREPRPHPCRARQRHGGLGHRGAGRRSRR